MSRSLKLVSAAAAAFCLAGIANAQSSVNIYGIVDMSAGRFQYYAGTTKLYKAESGNMATSFIGFKGTEDLGGGLKAVWSLESFISVDNGGAGRFQTPVQDVFWARDAYVGLQGAFGTTVLGRAAPPLFISTLLFNAFSDSFGFSPAIRQLYNTGGFMPGLLGDSGWSNSVNYTSPNMGGFTANVAGSLGEGQAGATGRNLGGNVTYFGGPFGATVALQQVKNGAGFPTGIPGFKSQDAGQVGASYDFSVVKIFGQYSQITNKATVETKVKIYGLGASVPIGNGALLAQYGNSKETAPIKRTNKTISIGYDYNLSKNTDIYAVAMKDRRDGTYDGNTVAAGLKVKF